MNSVLFPLVCITILIFVKNVVSVDNDACSDIQNVQNLRYADDIVYWDPPVNSDGCDVTYKIIHRDNSGQREYHYKTLRYISDVVPCSSNKLTVTPVVNGTTIASAETSINYEGPVTELPAPTVIAILPGATTAEFYWRGAPLQEHACPILAVHVVVRTAVSQGGNDQIFTLDVVDNPQREFKIEFEA